MVREDRTEAVKMDLPEQRQAEGEVHRIHRSGVRLLRREFKEGSCFSSGYWLGMVVVNDNYTSPPATITLPYCLVATDG